MKQTIFFVIYFAAIIIHVYGNRLYDDNNDEKIDVISRYEDNIRDVIHGTCGDNMNWTLDDKTLTINGTGLMYNFTGDSDIPWFNYRLSTTNVRIEEGASSIGNYALSEDSRLT